MLSSSEGSALVTPASHISTFSLERNRLDQCRFYIYIYISLFHQKVASTTHTIDRTRKKTNTKQTQTRISFCNCALTVRPIHIGLLLDCQFLRATAGTAIARLSHRNSVRPSVRLSVTRVDQAKNGAS